jgi:branched-chain amino acid transport system permease protein
LTVLPEFLRVVGFEQWRLVVYPLLLIALMLWWPSGLMGDREFAFLRAPKEDPSEVRDAAGQKPQHVI